MYQPLDYGDFLFVNPQVRLERHDVTVSIAEGIRAQYRIRTQEASLHTGIQFGTYGEMRVGVFTSRLSAEGRVAPPELQAEGRRAGGWTARLTLDQIDNPSFPRSGSLLAVDGVFHRERFGAEQSFHRVRAHGRRAFTIGRNTILAAWSTGSSLDSSLPLYEEFELGGFLSLSGLEQGQLRGSHFGLLDLIYLNELSRLPGPLGAGTYLGVSLETGNVWRDSKDVALDDLRVACSVFMAADSVIGPIYLAVGWAEAGNASIYLSLGGLLSSE